MVTSVPSYLVFSLTCHPDRNIAVFHPRASSFCLLLHITGLVWMPFPAEVFPELATLLLFSIKKYCCSLRREEGAGSYRL